MYELNSFMDELEKKNPAQPEFIQAARDVLESIIDVVNNNPVYLENNILDRLVEPDRIFSFKVEWEDDNGKVQVNRGWRVQFNNAIGPYKGGLRFHPSVTEGTLKFLAFEQMFKNSLTTLAMGGGKGGSNFDPHGKSDNEVLRFCRSFMTELHRYIGADTDVPAGDIGVGAREIGFLYGQYKRLAQEFTGTLTGKGANYGGSLLRPEATGYGLCYFVREMLVKAGKDYAGKVVTVSGSGNVAQYATEKSTEWGAKVVTLSDSSGYIYDEAGIDKEKLAYIMELKNVKRGRISEYVKQYPNAKFFPGERPWGVKCDIALPCATQNELNGDEAKVLVSNGCFCVGEGANMPSTPEAVEIFHANKVLYAPGKASNAGGVATSGLEMSQNSLRLKWTREEVEERLAKIMSDIHESCVAEGTGSDGYIDYVKGANIAGFRKVADAMISLGY